MGENTKIEWAHHTFNPWRGCTKVSPGCANCYAATFSKRNPKILGVWGDDGTRVIAAPQNWLQVLNWNDRLEGTGQRERVFCASLADVFEDWTGPVMSHQGLIEIEASVSKSGEWKHRDKTISDVRRTLFEVIDRTPNLDWLLVTKRPENIRRMTPCKQDNNGDGDCSGCSRGNNLCKYRPNVWLLTSVENQEQADKRIPELLKCRDLSPVLGLSCEPLLGPVEIVSTACGDMLYSSGDDFNPGSIDWVIVGGESGHDARPMHPDWARSLRDQCQSCHDGIPFFFKQWGEWSPWELDQPPLRFNAGRTNCVDVHTLPDLTSHEVVDQWYWPADQFAEMQSTVIYRKSGKAKTGRLLDGCSHDEFPHVWSDAK